METTLILLLISCSGEVLALIIIPLLMFLAGRSGRYSSQRIQKIGCGGMIISFAISTIIISFQLGGDIAQDEKLKGSIREYIANASQFSVSNDGAYIKGKLAIFDKSTDITITVLDFYPEDVNKAYNFDEAGTIIVIECNGQQVSTYDDGRGAYQDTCKLTVIDKTRNTIVGQASFIGPQPPSSITCRNGVCDSGHGGIPKKEIQEYIRNLPQK